MIKDYLRPLAEKISIIRSSMLDNGNYEVIDNPKRIIFNRIYTRFSISFFHEIAIAKALQYSGHNVLFLICNRTMRLCTPTFSIKNEDEQNICDNCSSYGKSLLKALKIPFLDFSEEYNSEYNKKFEKTINASIDRYYKGILERDKIDVAFLKYIKNKNASKSLNFAKYIFKKYKPDIIFSTHYGYAEWNPFYEYMKSKNVKYIVWDYSYGQQKMIFDLENIGERFDKIKKYITKYEIKKAKEYINERKNKLADTRRYNFDTSKDIKVGDYKKTFCIFPNLSWDTSLINSNKIFESIYDWVDETIEFFKKRKEYQLFIKVHPAELTDGSYKTIADYIKSKHDLTDNISIIDNDSGIGAYTIFDNVDVGLVYNGTVGIEMSCYNKPVILAGDIFYRGKGFTYDARSKKHYFDLIDTVEDNLSIDKVKIAKSFAYFYMIHSSIPVDFVVNTKLGSKFNFKRFKDLLEDHKMNRITSYILED